MKNGIQSEQEVAQIINKYQRTELEKFNEILQAKYDGNYEKAKELTLALTTEERQKFDQYGADLKLINSYQTQHPSFSQQSLYLNLYGRKPSSQNRASVPSNTERRVSGKRLSGTGFK